ncbi:MAG: 3-phosphoshikimate 1-carboxyvinyltransferase [Roseivirga sp.]|nr:3-phosphoshikimate 1-carboxyvinyltransferase [Roseivirga sp.]
MEAIHLKHTAILQESDIALSSSKSESNRALIIQALSENPIELHNLSDARDTQTMTRLLKSEEDTWDVLDAGTTMRFLCGFAAVGRERKILTGTKRMQQRPVKILADALKTLGAKVEYLKKDGYPPLAISPIKTQKTNTISIKGDVSSQYISALLMIAPTLPEGLTLTLTGKIGSRPYIQMTLDLMNRFGIESNWSGDTIEIKSQAYQSGTYTIESDWSAASYWYSFISLSQQAKVKLLGLRAQSMQGDTAIVRMMNSLGVMSAFEDDGVVLQKIPDQREVSFDFTDCPDLAQTIAVVCAVKKIPCQMSGLESLRIKETDRIAALKKELKKFKVKLKETEPGVWEVRSKFQTQEQPVEIQTYEDHRMAMAFAPLCTQQDLVINDPSVVNKSYPGYWNDLRKAGVETKE